MLSSSPVLRAVVLGASSLLLTACPWSSSDGGPDPETTCVAAPPAEFDGTDADRLDVGTSTDGVFSPIHDGQAFPMVFGPQGGQHFFYTLRVHTGATPLVMQATLRDAGGAKVGSATEYAEACDETWFEIQNARLFLDSSTPLTGTFTLQLGTCPTDGCTYDENAGTYTLETILAERSFQVSVTNP